MTAVFLLLLYRQIQMVTTVFMGTNLTSTCFKNILTETANLLVSERHDIRTVLRQNKRADKYLQNVTAAQKGHSYDAIFNLPNTCNIIYVYI